MPNGSLLSLSKEGDEEEKGIIARREDEVLSDRIRTLLSFVLHSSTTFFCAGFGEARSALRNARVLPAAPPSYFPFCADE